MTAWTDAEKNLLRKVYADMDNHSLAAMFNRNPNSLSKYARNMGLEKSPEFLAKQRREAQENMIKAWVARPHKAAKEIEAKGKRIATGVLEINGNVRTHRMV
jgi:hypothetical protein